MTVRVVYEVVDRYGGESVSYSFAGLVSESGRVLHSKVEASTEKELVSKLEKNVADPNRRVE